MAYFVELVFFHSSLFYLYLDLHISIEILDIECHSLKQKKKEEYYKPSDTHKKNGWVYDLGLLEHARNSSWRPISEIPTR
jgi:hypothetical protein